MKTARLFIAIPLPLKIQKTLGSQLDAFELTSVRVRPVPLHDMHMTLKFLGEIEDSAIPAIIDSLETITSDLPLFDLEMTGGILLPKQRPRTIGVRLAPSPELQELYDTLDEDLAMRGIADQDRRQFNPHITVARIDGTLAEGDLKKIQSWPCQGIYFTADEVRLIESALRPQGPLYTILTTAPLQ